MLYEAILLDMDGVIIDTHQAVTLFWQKWAKVHQVQLSQADFQQNIYGCPANHTLDVLFPVLNIDEREAIMADMTTYEINQTYRAVEGVLTFLRDLKREAVPTALVTSGEHWKVDAVLTQLELNGIFDATVTAADIRHGKPSPECYLLGAERLQRSPERCIVFEDAISGVKAAVAAGALCIGVQAWNETPLLAAGARYVVPDFMSVKLEILPEDGHLSLQLGSRSSLLLQKEGQ